MNYQKKQQIIKGKSGCLMRLPRRVYAGTPRNDIKQRSVIASQSADWWGDLSNASG